MFGKLLSELKTSNQVSKIRLKTLGLLAGAAAVGMFLGIVLTASKLMGDAEVHPANQLPAAPKLWIYLLVGLVLGVNLGLIVMVLRSKLARCD